MTVIRKCIVKKSIKNNNFLSEKIKAIRKRKSTMIENTVHNINEIQPFTFVLNEKEKQLVELFRNICEYIHQSNPNLPPITVRFVGGWVRDKVRFFLFFFFFNIIYI